jgi:hypothetical protein
MIDVSSVFEAAAAAAAAQQVRVWVLIALQDKASGVECY